MKATDLVQAIHDKRGNVSAVARHFGVSRVTVYSYIKRFKSAQDALEEARETMLDEAESTLYDEALNGNTTALIFFLKTQGKRRGYVERQEVAGPDGSDITIKVEYVHADD